MSDEMPDDLTRSSRDVDRTASQLGAWLTQHLDGEPVEIVSVSKPDGTGMSSETVIFTAASGGREHDLVARIEPAVEDVPVFPHYDLALQFRVMGLVGAHSSVPVPTTRWYEGDPTWLGGAFFVMDRIEGEAASDIPPYTFEGWLHDASRVQRARLQEAAVEVLAGIHSIDLATVDHDFLEVDAPGDTPLRRHVNWWKGYYEWVRGDRVHPICEQGFDWLERHWPEETAPVISWGDSRIGNVLWEEFEPVAVLDWELAAIGPRELDLGWMIFLHSFFQDIAERFELPGLPEFMHSVDVAATYESLTGHAPVSLHWFETYAAVRHAVIMARIHDRTVHFGQGEWTDDLDAPIYHRDLLASMLAEVA